MGEWFRRTFADPQIDKYVLSEDGERLLDDVRRHWVAYWRAGLEGALGIVVFVIFLISPVEIGWLPFLLSIALAAHAAWLALNEHMDRFVITDRKVFRVRGALAQKRAAMPIGRILDITVEKPILGRMLGYGHLVFESAAQEQGLREIRYVGDPDDRDITIQRAVQAAARRPAGG